MMLRAACDSEADKALSPDDALNFTVALKLLRHLKDDTETILQTQAQLLRGMDDIRCNNAAGRPSPAGATLSAKSQHLRSYAQQLFAQNATSSFYGSQGPGSDDVHESDSLKAVQDPTGSPMTRGVSPPRSMPPTSPWLSATPSLTVSKALLRAPPSGLEFASSVAPQERRLQFGSEDREGVLRSQSETVEPWPANIKMRKSLDTSKNSLTREAAREKLSKAKGPANKLLLKDDASKAVRKGRCCCRVQDPNSKMVTIYEMLSILAFSNDLIITPYVVAWELALNLWINLMSCVSAVYWTLGILVRTRTGFYEGGELKMSQREILRHYARTDLVLDVVLVVIDWTALMLVRGNDSQLVKFRFSKLFRITKVIRLAHVWRLIEKSLKASEYFNDSTVQTLAIRLLQLVLSTALFTHIMCCAWYSIGRNGYTDTEDTWIQMFGDADAPFTYTTSFHWTLAQLTLGAMEISPTNSFERLFCIVLLLFGMIFSATIVSLISSQTMAYVQTRREQTEMLEALTRFLDQNRVDTKLQVRVRRQVLDRLSSHRLPLTEEDVIAINMLSTELKRQLLVRTREKYLLTHDLFRTWAQIDNLALRDLCDDEKGPISFRSYKSQDFVFLSGQEADGARHAVQGKFRYIHEAGATDDIDVNIPVRPGTWVSESALWAHWYHVGRLESEGSSQMMLLGIANFFRVLQKHELVGYLTREYGRAFYGRMATSGPPFSEYPTDLHVPNTDASDLVSQDVGMELLRRERSSKDSKLYDVADDAFEELMAEVDAEKCSIIQSHDGELERIVALVAVKITRSFDERMLVEVGSWNKGDLEAKGGCALPAKKRVRSELPGKVFEQILSSNLKELQASLALVGKVTLQAEVKDSAKFGLKTRYLRSILEVLLSDEFSFQDLPVMVNPYKTTVSKGTITSRRRPSLQLLSGDNASDALTRASSTQTVKGGVRLEEDFSQADVFLIPASSKKFRLYAWLLPSTVEHFRSESGEEDCQRWIARLSVPQELFQDEDKEVEVPISSLMRGVTGGIAEELSGVFTEDVRDTETMRSGEEELGDERSEISEI